MTATAFLHDPVLEDDRRAPAQLQLVTDPGLGSTPRCEALAAMPLAEAGEAIEVVRRRRFLVLLAVTVVALVLSHMAGISPTSFDVLSPSTPALGTEAAPTVYVVRPGDTYEAIAVSLGGEHPASLADQLRSANGGADLAVGQRMVIDLPGLE